MRGGAAGWPEVGRHLPRPICGRLEELEDIEDLKRIRHEPTRPLAEVLAELDLDG